MASNSTENLTAKYEWLQTLWPLFKRNNSPGNHVLGCYVLSANRKSSSNINLNEVKMGILPTYLNEVKVGILPTYLNEVKMGILPTYLNEVNMGILPTYLNEVKMGILPTYAVMDFGIRIHEPLYTSCSF